MGEMQLVRRPALHVLGDWMIGQTGRFNLWLPICALLGDAGYFSLRHEPPGWYGAVPIVAGAVLALVPTLATRVPGMMLLFAGIGFGAAQIAAWRATPFVALPTRAASITGRIAQTEALPGEQRVLLDEVTIDGAPIGPRRLRIRTDGAAEMTPGQDVALRAMVAPPSPPAYPGGWDLQRDAYFNGLAGYGIALGPVTSTSPPGHRGLQDLRSAIGDRVRHVLPGAAGAIAATLLTGDASAIPPADRAAFRDAGLSHLLAIAGLHVGIVMGLALLVTRFMLLRSERVALFCPVRQIATLAALGAGLGYLMLTGMHVPILRSFAMACLAAAALLAGRRVASPHAWGIACLAVILLEPEQITGPSFQLSFAAVLALIAGYEVLAEALAWLRGEHRWRRILHAAATLALTSLLAGGASIPFIAYHFGAIQLYFVVANMIAVPLTALWVMPAGLLSLTLMPFGLDRLSLPIMGIGINLLLTIARHVAAWPAATLTTPDMPLRALVAMAVGLAMLCLWRGRTRLAGIPPILIGLALWTVARPPDLLVSADGRLLGLRTPTALLIHADRRADEYVADQWSRHLGLPPRPFSDCGRDGCRLPAPAEAVVLGHPANPCIATRLLLQPGGATGDCPGSLSLDRADTWQQGAWTIWLRGGPTLLSDREMRGDRRWVFLPPEQQRRSIRLPMATTETLPEAESLPDER